MKFDNNIIYTKYIHSKSKNWPFAALIFYQLKQNIDIRKQHNAWIKKKKILI